MKSDQQFFPQDQSILKKSPYSHNYSTLDNSTRFLYDNRQNMLITRVKEMLLLVQCGVRTNR